MRKTRGERTALNQGRRRVRGGTVILMAVYPLGIHAMQAGGPSWVNDILLPLSEKPFFVAAEQADCNSSCSTPVAAAVETELALGMALPKEVKIDCKA